MPDLEPIEEVTSIPVASSSRLTDRGPLSPVRMGESAPMRPSAYIPFAQRERWADLEPIEQDDGPNPLVPIMYTEEYKDMMNYFRALVAANEYSERGLELSQTVVRMNSAHYTVWNYRMKTLLALGKDLEEELAMMEDMARTHLKSYQVWHHRLTLLSHISPASPRTEIDFVHTSFLVDPKNYHTWAYLHWLYSHFSDLGRITPQDWKDEEGWCDEMIRVDGRNNSAWGWRWFLRVSRPGLDVSDRGKSEIEYTLKQIHKIPHNVSAWNYLRGLMKHYAQPLTTLLPSILPYTLRPSSPSLPPTDSSTTYTYPLPSDPLPDDTPLPIPLSLEYLADALLEEGKPEDAKGVYSELGGEFDRMRAGYWEWRKRACV